MRKTWEDFGARQSKSPIKEEEEEKEDSGYRCIKNTTQSKITLISLLFISYLYNTNGTCAAAFLTFQNPNSQLIDSISGCIHFVNLFVSLR